MLNSVVKKESAKIRRGIVINCCDSHEWATSLYYKKNIIYQLLIDERVCNEYYIYIYCYKEMQSMYSVFENKVEFIYANDIAFSKTDLKKMQILNVAYVFPSTDLKLFIYNITPIAWIADFQQKYYPQYFSKNELFKRNLFDWIYAHSPLPLVLSSKSALNDFKKYFNCKRNDIVVMPFVSYLCDDLKALSEEFEKSVLDKYELTDCKYVYIANQFWQHKNHIAVIEAMRNLLNKGELPNIKFVFTGMLSDYRNPTYPLYIASELGKPDIKDYVKNLGFVSRQDQLVIMRHSEFMIQPSLFEGWSTVVEDAKSLGKTILLSSIPVHYEQYDGNQIYFDPNNSGDLSEFLSKEFERNHKNREEEGLKNINNNARKYVAEFAEFLLQEKKDDFDNRC